MGSLKRCEHCHGAMIPDYDLLKSGEIIRVTKCVNCGRRPIPPPLVTEPSRDLTHYSQKEPSYMVNGEYSENIRLGICSNCHRQKEPSYMVNGEYSENTRLGICSNCHREIPLVANHRCKFCENRKDNLEEAARIVHDWIAAGRPVHLGAFAKWRWKPVEGAGNEVRTLRCG